jgi:hypothetical protein
MRMMGDNQDAARQPIVEARHPVTVVAATGRLAADDAG